MKEFIFTAEVTVSATTRVKARNEAEAREKVENRGVEIGGWGTGVSDEEVWVIDSADGEPQNIKVEK